MKSQLEHIKSIILELGKIIEAPDKLLPTFGNSRESHPNIDIHYNGHLIYEIFERGIAIKTDYAFDLDHLLYLVFKDVTHYMALEFASKNLQLGTDIRRIQFRKQLELLGKLNIDWEQKEKANQVNAEKQFPFNDNLGKKDAYIRELLSTGFLLSEATVKANMKFK